MTFEEILDQALAMLQRRGRVTYRALRLQFQLNDDQLEALKDELLYAHPQVVDDAGRGLLWTGTPAAVPPAAAPAPAQDRALLSYTPQHLAEKILTSRAALEGERKQVTVLFADLKGSMELLADRDPEEARQLLDPVLERMMAAVHRYEGTVNQVMGDGIMALFGAPIAHEDHAVRACYAALAMQTSVKQYAAEVQRTKGVPIQIRVGLNAGEVVVRSVIDLLKAYCQIEARDDVRGIREKLTGKLLTLDETLKSTLPAMLALLDVPVEDAQWQALDPPQRRRYTLEAVKRLLIRESQVQPVLVVFEDLHWIDSETQALLDSLVESLPTTRILLLVNYRPEYQHGWNSKTYYAQLRLDPLPAANADEFLQALLGHDLSLGPLKPRLIAQTQGNPFFLEESVRTLVETGVLVGNRGAYRLAQSLDSLQVPATVQALLAARVDRLPLDDKRLLQTAAVISTEVPGPLLQVIADTSEGVLHRGLTHLQAAEFLYETQLFPEHTYTFKHALTYEVAYGSLLQERRRLLHARIVAALEALAGERVAEQLERLTHHALRGEVWDKTVTYCQQAGVRAHDRAAFREAVASFEQALQALAHLPDHSDTRRMAIELRLALDPPLRALGEQKRRLALLGEAEALARALDDRTRLGRVLASMALVLRATGDLDGAMAAGQQALNLAAALGDSALQVRASLNLAQAYYASGDFRRAAELVRQNMEAADRESATSGTNWRIESRAWLAQISSALGTFAEGRRHGEEALRLATLEGRGSQPIIVHGCLGDLYLAQGDLEHAIRVLEQGLALCRASDNRNLNLWRLIAASLGYASALQGHLTEGHALLEEAVSESLRTGGPRGLAGWVAWLSEVCRLAGRGAEAWQHARQALDLARQRKARGDEARALFQLGVIQAYADPPHAAQAEADYRQALVLAEALGMRPLVAHCHLGLGTVYAKLGRQAPARAELSVAIELFHAMEMTFWLPQAEAVLAQVEGR